MIVKELSGNLLKVEKVRHMEPLSLRLGESLLVGGGVGGGTPGAARLLSHCASAELHLPPVCQVNLAAL